MARSTALTVVPFVANPTISAVTPTGGAAGSYTYKLVAVDSTGALTAASAGTTQAAGPTTLDVTHYNTITWTDPVHAPASILVYRTAGGLTQGLIGTVLPAVGTFRDDGKVGDGLTPSAANGTGIGPAVPTADLRDMTLAVAGTFTATVKLQGTHTPLGAWADLKVLTDVATSATSITSPSVVAVFPPTVGKVRLVMTAYTSGTVTASIAGH